MGKAMLSLISEEDVHILYRGVSFELLTEKTVADLEQLTAELSRVRAQGYAMDEEETAPGMVCVGAPITISSGQFGSVSVGAVAVSFRRETATDAYRAKAIEYIQNFAALVSERIV
jgi:DNA-binding IclR family transcriptional regulator